MQSTRRRLLIIAAVLALTVGVSQAWADKPDFSGTWKLNNDKSEFGPMPAPDKWESKVNHKDPALKYTTVQSSAQGEMTTETNYTTDGKECTNKFMGNDYKGTAKWDGDALVIDSKRDFQGMEITIQDRWTLSPDGKVLTIARKVSTPQGDFDAKMVAEKQ